MNQLTIINAKEEILSAEREFRIVSSETMVFEKEYNFAMQALAANDFLLQTALKNPQSLKAAIINVGAVGLSLNSAEKMAYLVPLNGAVHLMVSYMGLAKLAVMDGGALWLHSEVVCEKDIFNYMGVDQKPEHKFNPFQDRGRAIGVYAVVKTHDGSFLSRMLSVSDCEKIRDRTQIWQKSKSGPWKTDPEEMYKKTAIKNLAKTIPRISGSTSRLNKAIEVQNEFEGIDFEKEKEKPNLKISNDSKLLSDKLRAPVLCHADPVCEEIIQSIKSICSQKCEGFTLDQKRTFVKTKLQIDSFNDLYSKDSDYLLEMEKFLLDDIAITTNEIPWEE